MATKTASMIPLALASVDDNYTPTDYDEITATYTAHCYNYGSLATKNFTEAIPNPTRLFMIKSIRISTLLYSSVVGALIIAFGFGYDAGFPSPALHDLDQSKGKHTYFKKIIYHDTFNALSSIGALIGAPIAGWLVDYHGRQFTLVLCTIPMTIGWLLIAITTSITGPLFRPLLFTGRFITGIGVGSATLVVPLYTAEISPKQLRGMFGSVIQLSAAIGVFVAQALGIVLHYDWLCVVVLAVLFMFVVLASSTLKESPRWLIAHGKDLQATKVLAWLRGPNFNVSQEQREIKEQLVSERKLTLAKQVQDFSTRRVLHPLILSMGLMFFQQFTGIKIVLVNGQEIFEQAGVSDAAVTTAFAIGAALTLATLFGVFLADILKRKLLLVLSATIMCFSMAVLSIYDFLRNEPYCDPDLTDSKCKSNLQPLAIVAMAAYTIGYSIGWCTLPWVQASELIPLRVRGAAVGIATGVNWVSSATILFSYGSYQSLVKPWGTFLTFSVINFLAIIFVIIFVPETKGKSLEEIERYFNHHHESYSTL